MLKMALVVFQKYEIDSSNTALVGCWEKGGGVAIRGESSEGHIGGLWGALRVIESYGVWTS